MIEINLSGKTAVVTGSGQGLGAATAGLLAQAGANVVINYFNDPEGVNRGRARETATRIGPWFNWGSAGVDEAHRLARQAELTVVAMLAMSGRHLAVLQRGA